MSKKEILPGIHTVAALLQWQPQRAQSIWLEQNKKNPRIGRLIGQAQSLGIAIQQVQRHKLDQLCEGSQHQGIAAHCLPAPLYRENDLLADIDQASHRPLLLALDEVIDTHNLGACLRTASGAGVDAVILPQRRSAPLTASVHKIASGATISLRIVKTANLARCLDNLKKAGIWICGADGQAPHSLYESSLTLPTAIVIGAESRGLRRLTRQCCDRLYALPMRGQVESLNVSVASGIFLYEAVRQRQAQ